MRQVTVFLAVGWFAVMTLLGWLLFSALGWLAIALVFLVTAIAAFALRRKHGSFIVNVLPEQATMLIGVGACMAVLLILGAILALTKNVGSAPQALGLMAVACVSVLGAGITGRKAVTLSK